MCRFRQVWTNVGLVSWMMVAMSAQAPGQVERVIAPSVAATHEGDFGISPSPVPLRIQSLFPASDFAGLPKSHRLIVAHNYRGDQTQTENVDWSIQEHILLSTTGMDSTTMSVAYADNPGPDEQTVFHGQYGYRILGTGPPNGPRDFAEGIRFQTPFYYDPSQGNLLIEKRVYGNYSPIPSPTIDIQTTFGSSTLAWNDDPMAPAGVLLANLPVTQFEFAAIHGDFNYDGLYDCADIDALVSALAAGSTYGRYDLNSDGVVDLADRDAWLVEAGAANLPSAQPYLLGDANLDGVVDGSDHALWNSNKFTSNASWCSGDFSADGSVDGSDFNLWNANKFQASDVSTVPEPGTPLFVLLACLASRRVFCALA